MVAIGPDLGTALHSTHAWTARRWEAEHLPQDPGGLLVTNGDVHPDQPIVAGQQLLQLSDRMLDDSFIGHEVHVHPTRHLPGAVSPAPSLAPPRPRRRTSPSEYPARMVAAFEGAASGLLV